MPLPLAHYSATAPLRDGRSIEIRALGPADREEMLRAIGRSSGRSLYRRFFAPRRDFSESEVDFFVNVDFIDHVALVAVLEEEGRPAIVGGGRYVVVAPGRAELAFVVVDGYQGQGIGSALLHHLILIARAAGIERLIADVLPENAPMLSVFRRSGIDFEIRPEAGVLHVTLSLA